MRRSHNLHGRSLQKAGQATLLVTAAFLSGPAAADPTSDHARISALEAELSRVEGELAELKAAEATRQRGSSSVTGSEASASSTVSAHQSSEQSATLTPSPTSPATAGLGQQIQVATSGAGETEPRPRTFGPGIPTTAAVSSIDAGRPVIQSRDGRFSASLLAVMQFDVADYFQRGPGPLTTDLRRGGAAGDTSHARELSDGSDFRRARIGIGGRAFGDFEYSVLFDFGGSGVEDNGHVQELWLQYSGIKPLHFRVGAFAPFIGLEDAGSTNGMMFLERPAPADISRSLAGGDYREGGQTAFVTDRFFASGAVTGRLVNTAGASASQTYRNQLGFVGRVAYLPIKTDDQILHIGGHGSWVAHAPDTGGPDAAAGKVDHPIEFRERPELRVDGTRLIDTGSLDARHAYTFGGELAYQYRNLMLQGEYERIGIERTLPYTSNPHFHGYYAEVSWIPTGQARRYNSGNFAFDGPSVPRSFDPRRGQWGVWELAVRYSDMDLNYEQGALGTAPLSTAIRGGNQKIVTGGVNWYLNSIARMMFDVQHVDVDRISPDAVTFLTPIGAEIGQHYYTASARFQLAF